MKNNILKFLEVLPVFGNSIRKIRFSRKFKNELDLIKKKAVSTSETPSVLHFSVNKAATQHVKKVLKKISYENGMTSIGLHDYAFHSNFPYLDSLNFDQMEEYKYLFKGNGYVYSVFGGMIENIDKLEGYKIILTIRDPRDILVSSYFSNAFSHTVPGKTGNKRDQFLTKRNWANEVSIDDYVLSEVVSLFQIFERYKSELAVYSNVAILKYEEMISNYEGWLNQLLEKSGLSISESLFKELLLENQSKAPLKEERYSHYRKGVSGDYLEKLKPVTIEKLNIKLMPLLEYFKY